jgi:hypothetical protein
MKSQTSAATEQAVVAHADHTFYHMKAYKTGPNPGAPELGFYWM